MNYNEVVVVPAAFALLTAVFMFGGPIRRPISMRVTQQRKPLVFNGNVSREGYSRIASCHFLDEAQN
jgi:hypothetical protein